MKIRRYNNSLALALAVLAATVASRSHAGISLIANGSIPGTSLDYSGLSGNLENGQSANLLGGLGSGLTWAGGTTFLGLPDRGPNAVSWNSAVDNTTTYVSRFQTLNLQLTPSGGALPFTLTPTLTGTTLLYDKSPLNYGSSIPSINSPGYNYFSGRSDNFAAGTSLNPSNARLDPEGLRVSNDGQHVFVSDEYGPYVYQFNRGTGERERTFSLPANFGVNNQSSTGATEISGNTTGRVANKGMEGLAITPDGKSLVGFMQSPLIQDGGDGGRANRIVTIDIATGATKQFIYDNKIDKAYNSSEIVALNDHQFLVLERDGKGLGDGSKAVVKQLFLIDLKGATDVTNKGTGEANLLQYAVQKTLFLDIKSALVAAGFKDDQIPAKLEGVTFGQDVVVNGKLEHTLYIANDNDFLSQVLDSKGNSVKNPNQWFVFGFSDADLAPLGATYVSQAIPDGGASTMTLAGVACLGLLLVSRRARTE